ncbi:MAG TPA: cytochrome b N-terminal domain-containing protein [Thermoanaerobaculia bacterium]|nr:cytochrome b N-terminal domain-containing protein [Thermoanaerobaculia bacterium]
MDRPALTDGPGPRAGPPSGGLGRLSFGFLAVSVVSGVFLVPFWTPAAAWDSLERIQGGIAWGFFLRALHAYSSFGVLVTAVLHVVQVLAAKTERQLLAGVWWRSVVLLPVTVAALLGGFVLRGDAEAVAALSIWRRILESLPLAGAEVARLFLGSVPGDLGPAALHHAGTLTLLLWCFTAEHAGRLLPDARGTVLAALVSVALAGIVPLPLGAPPSTAPAHLLGPWSLLGLQGALAVLPPAAGWLAPLAAVLLFGFVRHTDGRARRALLAALVAWCAAYAFFTVRVLLSAR